MCSIEWALIPLWFIFAFLIHSIAFCVPCSSFLPCWEKLFINIPFLSAVFWLHLLLLDIMYGVPSNSLGLQDTGRGEYTTRFNEPVMWFYLFIFSSGGLSYCFKPYLALTVFICYLFSTGSTYPRKTARGVIAVHLSGRSVICSVTWNTFYFDDILQISDGMVKNFIRHPLSNYSLLPTQTCSVRLRIWVWQLNRFGISNGIK